MSNSRRLLSSIQNNDIINEQQQSGSIAVYNDYRSLLTSCSDINLSSSFIGVYQLNAVEGKVDGYSSKRKGLPKRVCMKFRLINNNSDVNNHNPINNNDNQSDYIINLMAKAITQKNFSNRKNIAPYIRGSFVVANIADGLKCVIFPLNESSKYLKPSDNIDFSQFETVAKLVRPRMIAINPNDIVDEKHPPMLITSGKDDKGGSTMVAFFIDRQRWGENTIIEAQSVISESDVIQMGIKLFQSNQSKLTIAKSFDNHNADLPINVPLLQNSDDSSLSYSNTKKRTIIDDDDDQQPPVKRSRSNNNDDTDDDHQQELSSDESYSPPSSPSNDSIFSEESMSESDDDNFSLPPSPISDSINELSEASDDEQSDDYQEKSCQFYDNISQSYKKESDLPPCPSPPFNSQFDSSSSSVDEQVNIHNSFHLPPLSSFPMQYLSNFSFPSFDDVYDLSFQLQIDSSFPHDDAALIVQQPSMIDDNLSQSDDDQWQPPYLDNETESALMRNYRPSTSSDLDVSDNESIASVDVSDDEFNSSTVVGAIATDAADDSLFF